MFTGLIETVGLIEKVLPRGNYRVLTMQSDLPGREIAVGESIACNGACLTVVEKDATRFTVEMSQETAARTASGRYEAGARINLERALRVGDRLGGHFVSGHIDGVGRIDRLQQIGDSWEIGIAFDPGFDSWVIEKGSIAIDGTSLTINDCHSGWLSVNVIPHTWRATNLADRNIGDPVNLEFDLIGKYVAKMKMPGQPGGLTVDRLLESGW